MNLCRACGQDFGSVGAFDRHRVGKHAYLWVPGTHEDGRRCLEADELEAKGWHRDSHGRWREPRRDTETPFWEARKPTEASK